jgi:HK97 family phage major capsid protein
MTDSINDFRRESQLTTRGESDSLELSFSSELPVKRSDWENGDYMEVLSHAPGDIDLSRLASGDHPLLLNHDPEKQIGIVERAWVANGKGRARVRFGKSALATEILNDVKSGIRKLVSVGYRRTREISSEVRDGMSYVKFAFLPYEVSIVPIPADASVGVGRAGQDRLQHRVEIMNNSDTPQNPEQTRIDDINLIAKNMDGKIPGVRDFCQRAIATGLSVAAVQDQLFKKMPGVVPVSRATIDIPDREAGQYSLSRAILKAADAKEGRGRFDGLEAEASREVELKSGLRAQGFFVPNQLLGNQTRTDNIVGVASLGGNLVATNLAAGSFIEILRNRAWVAKLGARVLDGLVGNLCIPRQTTAATAYWLTEIASTTQSNTAFDQLTLQPKCITGHEVYSKLALAQSSPSIDMLIRDDLVNIIALGIDKAAISGAGGAEPTGIANTAGITTVTLGAAGVAPTFAHMVSLESAVALGNADVGSLAYLTNSSVRGKLKQTPRTTISGAAMVWETPAGVRDGSGIVNGYLAACSNQIANNATVGTLTNSCSAAFFGNFNDLVLAQWGSIDLVVDIFSAAATREVKVYAHQYCDVGVRHAKSFSAFFDGQTS